MQEMNKGCLLGTEIIENIIATNLIRVRDEHLYLEEGKTEISDVDFSVNIRKAPKLMKQLEGLTEDFFSLFYFVEEEEALRRPMKEGAVLRSFIPFENTSGMTLLNLFSKGVLSLTVSGSQCVLAADTVFFDGMENGTEVLEELMNTVFRFRDERPILMITEKTEALVKTDYLGPGMHLTYEYRDDFEKTLKDVLARKADFPKNFGESRREANVRKEREALLGNIKALMDGINGETEEEPVKRPEPRKRETAGLNNYGSEAELREAVLRELTKNKEAESEASEPKSAVPVYGDESVLKEETKPVSPEEPVKASEDPAEMKIIYEKDEPVRKDPPEEELLPEKTGETAAEEKAPETLDDYEAALLEKEKRAREHREKQEREAAEARAYKNHYRLSFSCPVLYDKEDYSVQLPDGYEFGDDVDGHDFALWKCHHGHRKLSSAYVSLTDNGELPVGERTETKYDGSTLIMEFPVATSKRTIRFEVKINNVSPDEEIRARAFAKELVGAIQPL